MQAAAAARVAFKRQRAERSFRLALEPGSAVFFNTALNARWTHEIAAEGADAVPDDASDDAGSDGGDAKAAVDALVERFDIEPFSDFSAK